MTYSRFQAFHLRRSLTIRTPVRCLLIYSQFVLCKMLIAEVIRMKLDGRKGQILIFGVFRLEFFKVWLAGAIHPPP